MAIASALRAPRLLPLSLAFLRRAYATTNATAPPPPSPPSSPQHAKDTPKRNRKDQVPRFDSAHRRAAQGAKGLARTPRRGQSQDSFGTPSTIGKHPDLHRKSERDILHKQHGTMYVPQVCQKFIRNGRLQTTPDVWEFLQETGIEYDNSKSHILPIAPEHRHINQTFACKVKYSKLHIMHPYHLTFLQPRGHPFMESLKVKYRTRQKTRPLWLNFINHNADTGLVRSLGQRRLRREFWVALEELGGCDPEMKLSGTIMVSMYDAKKAASAPAWLFGKALADAIVKQHKWDKSEHRRLEAREEPGIREEPRTEAVPQQWRRRR
ncbi:hypothetical protein B0J13DRAFT_543388 [Dactylonectria estremocensis]|uniref:Ribosomal protein S10 domain-containing protein n=1 Tax=Dactylonectria estremocensis TaxID=1079267 RepID=A0A9P9FB66_9HYPO|nr:hypothetical protein B0J13DRAFT_543388 [Dactylonectria estremocensis]